MVKINLVLADSDELYLNQIDSYLIEHTSNFEVASFTSKESLLDYVLGKRNKIDVIAVSEDMLDAAIAGAQIAAKILLSDGSFCDFGDFKEGEFKPVNKYQKAERFINEILMAYAEKTGRVEAVSHGDKKTQLLGFYSPVGGCGKTTLAVGAAYALAAQGHRVFYLNAEKINSMASVFNQAADGSMSDVYLSLKTSGANVGLRIMANKFCDDKSNINYINPAESSLEINELTAEEFARLLQAFAQLAEFDVVVVDFDGDFDKEKVAQLQMMDKVVVPFAADEMALQKIELFVKELKMRDDLRDILHKAKFVLNKANNQNSVAVQQSGRLTDMGGYATVMLSPVFADVKNIFHAKAAVQTALAKLLEDM